MPHATPKVLLEQVGKHEDGHYEYSVVQTQHTTSPKLGAILSEERVKELIGVIGFDVTIRRAK